MTESDLTLLRQHGFADDLLICLTHLGYDLAHYCPVTDVADFAIKKEVHYSHGVTLSHRDAPADLCQLIFAAGEHHHQHQLKDTLLTLASLAGLQFKS